MVEMGIFLSNSYGQFLLHLLSYITAYVKNNGIVIEANEDSYAV